MEGWGQRQTRLSSLVTAMKGMELPGFRAGWEAEAPGRMLDRPASGGAKSLQKRVRKLGGTGMR